MLVGVISDMATKADSPSPLPALGVLLVAVVVLGIGGILARLVSIDERLMRTDKASAPTAEMPKIGIL